MKEKIIIYHKLITKVISISLIIIFVSIATLSTLSIKKQKEAYFSEFSKRGTSLCKSMASNSSYGLLTGSKEDIINLTKGIFKDKDVLFVLIKDLEGNVFYYEENSNNNNRSNQEYYDEVIKWHEEEGEPSLHTTHNGTKLLFITEKILNTEELDMFDLMGLELVPEKHAQVQEKYLGFAHIGISLEPIDEKLKSSTRDAIFIGAVLSILFSLIAYSFARRITKPVINLVDATRLISEGKLDHRAEITSKDEIGLLTRSFNKMTDDLEQSQNEIEEKSSKLNKAYEKISDLNLFLEKKVEERTTALNQAHEELKKRYEELQKLTEELEESNIKIKEADRLKSEFLANMSHELRTPLNSIIGFSSFTLDEQIIKENKSVQENIEQVHKNGIQLLNIINDILDLSKIESGKMAFIAEPLDVKGTIESITKTMNVLKKGKDITVSSQIEEDLPVIISDQNRFRQILLNIASNAVKFTEKGSIEIHAEKAGDFVQFYAKDTGIGIKQEDMSKVFESFRQIDGSATRKEGGTGLGMTISKKFVEMMGGKIWITSEFGKGTAMFFTLPVSMENQDEYKEEKTATIRQEPDKTDVKGVILIVEDNESTIQLYEKILSKHGYRTVSETKGTNVLSRVKELQPMAIFLDIMLPDKSGWDILCELKSEQVCKHIPIIISSIISEQNKGYALGAVEYLVKPVSEEDLLLALKRINIMGKKVVVIDDSVSDVLYLSKILEKKDYSIYKSYDGKDGIAKINKVLPDVVLLDLMMPIVDGFQVVEMMKNRESTHNIPIIILTAKDLTNDEKEYLSKQVNALIVKEDMSQELLLETLFDVLNKHKSNK